MQAIWIEIPVADLDRARRFYETVFRLDGTTVIEQDVRRIVVIEGEPNVSLNETPGFVPTAAGSLPYFHVDDLDAAISAVSAAGGTIAEAVTERPDLGRFALVHDSEGNALYLHGAA
ncbi:MAG: VOC family protein [Solirubrobacteraceae bacterium]|nr:VOC family protein [Solirubrobacteraceae bacterium]